MRIQIEPTEIMTTLDGQPVRVWNGVTEQGMQVFVFVARVAARPEDDSTETFAELIEMPQPDVPELRYAR